MSEQSRNRRLYKVLAALVVVPLVAVVAMVIWVSTLKVDRVTAAVAGVVERAVGRPVTIAGDVRVVPSLVPKIAVGDITIGDHDAPLARIEALDLALELVPLLSRRVVVQDVTVHAPTVVIDPDRLRRRAGEDAMPNADDAGRPGFPVAEIDVRRVVIAQARVVYRGSGGGSGGGSDGGSGGGPASGPDGPMTMTVDDLVFSAGATDAVLEVEGRVTTRGHDVAVAGTVPAPSRLRADGLLEFDVTLEGAGVVARIDGTVAEALTRPRPDLDVALKVRAPAALVDAIGIDAGPVVPRTIKARVTRDPSGRVVFDDLTAAGDGLAMSGRATVARIDGRPRVDADLAFEHLDLSPLMSPRASDAARVLPDFPLPATLPDVVDLRLDVNVTDLSTPPRRFRSLAATLRLDGTELSVENLSGRLDGGTIAGQGRLVPGEGGTRLSVGISGRNLPIASLVEPGTRARVRGGSANIAIDLAGSGASFAEMVSAAEGRVQIEAEGVSVGGRAAAMAGGDVLVTLLDAIAPFGEDEKGTTIECAVVDFPLKHGRLAAETGIGLMTRELSVLGGGSIDLDGERLALFFDPKPREGLGLSAAGIADFVRIGGTLADPEPVTDGRGLASLGVKTGAAIATGGLTLLAEALYDRAGGERDACEVVRRSPQIGGERAANGEPGPAGDERPEEGNAVEEAARSIESTLRGLFGD